MGLGLHHFEIAMDRHPDKQEQMWRLIDMHAHADRALFTSTIAPYLREQAASREEPIAQVSSLKDLKAAHKLLPTLTWKFAPAQISSVSTFTHDVLEHVVELDLSKLRKKSWGDGLLEAIASAPALRHVHTLTYHGGGKPYRALSEYGLEALARSPHLSDLRRLEVTGHPSEGGFIELVGSTAFALRHLKFRESGLTDEDAMALAISPHMRTLGTLDIGNNQIGGGGALALANSPHISRIEELSLWGNDLTDEGAVPLIEALTSRTRRLALRQNELGDETARALAASPVLLGLEELDLAFNQISDEGALALANATHARSVRRLSLMFNRLTDRGARALLESKAWPSLEEVVVQGDDVDSDIDKKLGLILKFGWRTLKNALK